MTTDEARQMIIFVHRRNKNSNKTDVELLDNCQMESIQLTLLAILICYIASDLISQYPTAGSLLLIIGSAFCAVMFNRVSKCAGAKKILFEKRCLNLD